MTIDEAIKHCLEVAEKNEISAITYKNCKEIKTNMYEKLIAERAENDCRECASDHRQLAEWLTELKEAKRLLKAAVDDLKFESQCRNSKQLQTGLYNICNGCQGNEYEWRYADEAKKLLNDEK